MLGPTRQVLAVAHAEHFLVARGEAGRERGSETAQRQHREHVGARAVHHLLEREGDPRDGGVEGRGHGRGAPDDGDERHDVRVLDVHPRRHLGGHGGADLQHGRLDAGGVPRPHVDDGQQVPPDHDLEKNAQAFRHND